ncbi:metal-sulfur cluster biosynthetic enzyme [Kibdelosporangium banguiense]|uniref:Metal-sulfur cluster biosynthetic enzyme n=1 Tax=Kibdelosporangium banguiense TaxID=1365924 RepID=A0ABS4TL36_9PSEU|nr:iron-sulfur cluster assembly protein [Kibdelosporangium banguiense]MBP2325122.1 metal-sulfur cluster biosynthetic enzyme [Kibdelosporangium banguiense]
MTGALQAQTALHGAVWAALGTVLDPELDEPLTDLGFVSHCGVSDSGSVTVRLRLPTYFCAPNFAFLMVADAYDAVTAVPGVRSVDVQLLDHFASDVINNGVAQQKGFVQSFEGEAVQELHSLRADFLRRAVLAGTDRVCRSLRVPPDSLVGMTLGEIAPSADLSRLRARRQALGLPCTDQDPLLIDPADGTAIPAMDLRRHLGLARVTRVSQEANSGVCRGMLRVRYSSSEEDS